jgi:hypothetical protein
MPVQTQLQTRRGTAASWTSTNPTLAAGEFGYETDTGKFKIGNGSTAWASLAYTAAATAVTYLYNATSGQTTFSGADANGLTLAYTVGAEQVYLNGVLQVRGSDYTGTNGTSIVLASGALTSDVLNIIAYSSMTITDTYTQAQANALFIPDAIVDAKGDLIAGTAADTVGRLAVGSSGDTLVADSSTATGLRYIGNYAAGKNEIINGDFGINQRSFTSTTTDQAYGFDRWLMQANNGCTYSAQTFTAGTAPVAGYEGTNFARLLTTGQTAAGTYSVLTQKIESVRSFANQIVTVSFWAKANSGTPKIALEINQNFGSGGSSSVSTMFGDVTISTSWTRYSLTGTVPSISGKTIGTSSHVFVNLWVSAGTDFSGVGIGIQSNTFDFWGVQAEVGSTATAFQTATGTIAGELAACQRYYWRTTGALYTIGGGGIAGSTTECYIPVNHPVTMRVAPTSIDTANLRLQIISNSFAVTSTTISAAAPNLTMVKANTASGLTATTQSYQLYTDNSSTNHFGLSAEL